MLPDVVRDFWSLYKMELSATILLLIIFSWYAHSMGCEYHLGDILVYGNCRELHDYDSKMFKPNFTAIVSSNVIQDVCPICKCEVCPVCGVMTSTTLGVVSSTIPKMCNCPVCVQPDNIDLQDIRNARPDMDSSQYQEGYFKMKRRCMVAVGLKPPKFNEGPGVSARNVEVVNRTQTVVFVLHGNEFFVNKTWDIVDGEDLWIIRPHVPYLNNTWENGSQKGG